MQKLDLRNNLHNLIVGLKSNEIVQLLDGQQLQGPHLMTHFVNSKAAFDRLSTDDQMTKVFDQFQLQTIYSTQFFAHIIGVVSGLGPANRKRTDFLNDSNITTFYSHHKTLLATFNIVENLLLEGIDFFDENRNFNIAQAQENGNLILQIIDDEKVSLDKIQDIIIHLNKLLETVYLLFDKIENDKFTEKPVVSMVDSGSDINFSVKVPKKAANLIAQIIKQMWDVIANNKSFRHNQKLKDVEKAISVMGKIDEAAKSGTIEPEMAGVLKKGVFENTREIILKNTLTKEIVIETKELSNRQMLLEQTKTYQIEQGKQVDEETESED
nr:hypothetical protein [uncultured Allomuricauda sp.]